MNRNPWASYWAQDGRAGQGCLPQAETRIGAQLARLWETFARTLPSGAKLLDLASGDGAVLKAMAKARRDLDLCGVDSAPALPKGKGFRLMAAVRMEALPFREASLDAVTSQFGVEYGDLAPIAAEVSRTLKPAGTMRWVVHHRASRIVAHNQRRLQALRWARQGSGIPEKARKLADMRRHVPLPIPLSFANAVRDAAARFPDQLVAAEYLGGIHQALTVRPEECLARLDWLDQNSADEAARIEALLSAARDEEGAAEIRSLLAASGLRAGPPALLREEDGIPFAWLIEGERRP